MPIKATKMDTALTVMGDEAQTGFNPLANIVEPERGSFLPTLQLPYAVQAELVLPVLGDDGKPMVRNGKPVTEPAAGKLIISSGKGRIEQIKAPYILSAYCIRGATRRLTDDKKYERTFASFNGAKNSEKHDKAMADAEVPATGVTKGNVGLIVVMPNDGKDAAAVCLMDMFKTQTKYWGELFKNGMFFNGHAVRVTIDDHNNNMQLSSNGYKYYSYSKFNQWTQLTLDAAQKSLIKDALRANAKACDEWLNRSE